MHVGYVYKSYINNSYELFLFRMYVQQNKCENFFFFDGAAGAGAGMGL